MGVCRTRSIKLSWIIVAVSLLIGGICQSRAAAAQAFQYNQVSDYRVGPTRYLHFTVTNVGKKDFSDLFLFITEQKTANWGRLTYVGNRIWRNQLKSGIIVQAEVTQPIDTARPQGEKLEFPYWFIGDLPSGQTSPELELVVQYLSLGGTADSGLGETGWHPEVGTSKQTNTNHPPVAYDSTVSTQVDTPVQFVLNASDPDGDVLQWDRLISGPSHGRVRSVRGHVPPLTVAYQPDPGFSGTDQFTFFVVDKKSQSNAATVTINVQGSQPGNRFSDDFEDGDYTSNPAWTISNPGYTWASVEADPVRPGNSALAIHGTDQAHGMLDASVNVVYAGFDCSAEFLATATGSYGPGIIVTNGAVSINVSYSEDTASGHPAALSFREVVGAQEYPHFVNTEGAPTNTWLKLRMWHDRTDGQVHGEIRRLADGSLIGELSFTPVTDLSTQPPISTLRVGAEETAWQYFDNVTLEPQYPPI